MGDDGGVASKRGKQTVRDMVLSMAVIMLVVAGIYALFLPHGTKESITQVDYSIELGQARRAAPYPVAAPSGLSGQWRATSVTYDDSDPKNAQWHLGFLDPENQYAAIEQSNGDAARFISDKTRASQRSGSQIVDGQIWERYDGGRYRALVREQPVTSAAAAGPVTTMVTGTAPYDQLAQLASALRFARSS
ncbi:MAG: DUF4245 domain-containing protein [Streptomycetaceae bacterium]|nr:DUF4245 domain-containing protein [Streptomycetaceae bacterium]